MHRLLATHKWVSWVKQAQLILLPILLQLVSYVLLNRLGVLSYGIDIIPFAQKFSISVCKLHVSILFYTKRSARISARAPLSDRQLFGRRPRLLHLSGFPCHTVGVWFGRNLPPQITACC